MSGLLRGAAAALLMAAAALAGLAPHHPASAAGDNWYQIESKEPGADFDPPPVDVEPEVYNYRKDWARGRASNVHYSFFDAEGINASLVLTSFASRIQFYSTRDNLDFFLGAWNVNYYDVGEVSSFEAPLGTFEYARFVSHNNGVKKSCIGFTHRFSQRKELSGYYCRADSASFDAGEIERVLSSVVIADD